MSRFKEIETERLHLRKLKESDWEVISFLRTDPDVNAFVQRPPAPDKKTALAFIDRITGAEESLYWSICLKPNNTMIGSICLWNLNQEENSAEVGYDLSPAYHGKGIMREALQAVISFGFHDLKLFKIEAFTQWNNAASVQLLTKSGFYLEPERRDPDNSNNRIYTLINLKP